MFKYQSIVPLMILVCMAVSLPAVQAEIRADSTGVKVVEGKIYIMHQVEPNETWYALSRKYEVNLERLMNYNGDKVLKTNEVILIPTDLMSDQIKENEVKAELKLPEIKKTPVYYRVKAGETLFSIAQRFNKSVFALREWNELNEEDISEGQQLIVNYIVDYKEDQDLVKKIEPADADLNKAVAVIEPKSDIKQIQEDTEFIATPEIPEQPKEKVKKKKKKKKEKSKPKPPANPLKISKKDLENTRPTQSVSELKGDNSKKVIKKYVETGIGAYLANASLNENRYYALHRTAPKGTIIKVTNTMNGAYVYVKVVGKLPDSGDNHNQIIKVSGAAAKKMGVLDTFFRTTLTYGVAE